MTTAVTLLLAGTAAADPSGTVHLSGHGNITDGTISVQGANSSGGVTGHGGIYTWTTGATTGDGNLVPDFGFCIELPQAPANGTYSLAALEDSPLPAQYGTPMGASKAKLLSELWGRYFDSTWFTNPTTTNKKKAESFSAAVWEIVYENPANTLDVTAWDGSGDSFRVTGGLTTSQITDANTWLGSLDGTGPLAPNLVALTSSSGQDFVVQIPAPGAVLLGLLGLGIVGWVRRKFA